MPRPSQNVRNAALQTTDGQTIRLADYAGKTVILELWMSENPSCRAQVPYLVRLKNEFAGKPVEVIALSIEDPATEVEKVRTAARELGLNYTAAFVPRDLALSFAKTENGDGIPIPQTVVLAPDGRIAKHVTGFDPDKDLAEIRRIIEKNSSSVAATPERVRGGA
jgi:peroxiredoxin